MQTHQHKEHCVLVHTRADFSYVRHKNVMRFAFAWIHLSQHWKRFIWKLHFIIMFKHCERRLLHTLINDLHYSKHWKIDGRATNFLHLVLLLPRNHHREKKEVSILSAQESCTFSIHNSIISGVFFHSIAQTANPHWPDTISLFFFSSLE